MGIEGKREIEKIKKGMKTVIILLFIVNWSKKIYSLKVAGDEACSNFFPFGRIIKPQGSGSYSYGFS